jgi:hypothetical protein
MCMCASGSLRLLGGQAMLSSPGGIVMVGA